MDKFQIVRIFLFTLFLLILSGCSTSVKVSEEPGDILLTNVETEELILRARKGDSNAQYALGYRYEHGKGVHPNVTSAISWYKRAAENGHLQALFVLGIIQRDIAGFLEKKGESKKSSLLYVESFKNLKKSAMRGYAKAQQSVGFLYLNGIGVVKNWSNAEKWFLLAAEQGDPLAEERLGRAYYLGGDAPNVDFDIAVKYFKRASEKNMSLSQYFLAIMFQKGTGVNQDLNKAFRLMLLSAESGFDEAQNNLALMYSNGEGTAINEIEAAKWLKKSADQNNANAQGELGRRHLLAIGVIKNPDEAKSLLLMAAENGNANAAYNLGILYEGLLYSRFKNYKQAFKWFHFAASNKLENSYFNVMQYCRAISCKVDEINKITSYIKASAEKGSSKSLHALGYMYETGVGVKENVMLSSLNYYKSARVGNRIALDRLISIYSFNNDINIQESDLFSLFQDYANKSVSTAYCGLGLLYSSKHNSQQAKTPYKVLHQGGGKEFLLAKDKSTDYHMNAYLWMSRCVDAGNRIYRDELYQLGLTLTPEQRLQLKARAALKN